MVEPNSLIPCLRSSLVSVMVSAPFSLTYAERGDSRPIQIQETPSSTSSLMVYWLMALAEENTYSDHALCPAFMNSSSSMARRLCSRKFSSIMKNDFTSSLPSISHMTSNSSLPES